jgi:hypothetical protein
MGGALLGKGDRLRVVVPHLRGDRAEGREDRTERRDDHPLYPQLLRHLDGMERPRAAKGEKRELAQVVALLGRADADAAHHVGVDHADNARGGLHQRKPQGFRNVLVDRSLGSIRTKK